MRGFKNWEGKFIPLNKAKQTLSSSDVRKKQTTRTKGTNSELKTRKDEALDNNDPPYCSGKHKCDICNKTFACEGEEPSHSGKKGSGRCQGEYNQFCPNHSHREMIEKHIEQGDLPKDYLAKSRKKESIDGEKEDIPISDEKKKAYAKLTDIAEEMSRQMTEDALKEPLIKEVPLGERKFRGDSKINYYGRASAFGNAEIDGKKIRPPTPTQEDFAGVITKKKSVD